MRTLLTTRRLLTGPSRTEIAGAFANRESDGFWLDIQSPSEEDLTLLADVFAFHPLALEDVRHQKQRPKLEEYSGYSFMVVLQAQWEKDELSLVEVHLFVGPNYLVTVRRTPSLALDDVRDRVARSPELAKGQPAFLTYLVIDALVDCLFPVLDRIDDDVDSVEDQIIDNPTTALLDRIYHLKHAVTEMRRFLGAQRDVFQRLVTHAVGTQQQDMTLYYRDVYDHIVRQYESVDSLRDLLTSAMDVYLSTVSNRLNQTMKTLTVIASLFLPLTFLSGFYGMNFAYLVNALESKAAAFWIGVGTMVVATGIQFLLFRRRGWI
jgi:magnesium transporter